MTFCGHSRGGGHRDLPATAAVPRDREAVIRMDAFAVQYFSAGLELGMRLVALLAMGFRFLSLAVLRLPA